MLVGSLRAEVLVAVDGSEQREPRALAYAEVEEALHDVELLHGLAVLRQPLANLLGRQLGRLAGRLDEGEYDQRQVAFKLAARLLQLQHFLACLHAVEGLHGLAGSTAYQCLDVHFSFRFFTFRLQS